MLMPEYLIGSMLGSLSCLMQHHEIAPPLRKMFLVEGIFPLVNMGFNSIPQKPLSDESINQGLVCAHMHSIVQTNPDIHVLAGECWQQKHTQHAPSIKTECDCLNGWIKKVTYAKISPKMVNPRDIARERRRRRRRRRKKLIQYCLNVSELFVLPNFFFIFKQNRKST